MIAENKLETIIIDIPNKIFEINGKPFSKGCEKLNISFENGMWEVNTNNKFYVNGMPLKKKSMG